MPDTMRAIRLTAPVDTDGLTVSEVPVPEVRTGWVRIRVRAFGVNESEVTSRKGESSPDFTSPGFWASKPWASSMPSATASTWLPGRRSPP